MEKQEQKRNILQRILREAKEMELHPPSHISAWIVDTSDVFRWEAVLQGPADTPYHGGAFRLSLHLPDRYPYEPPHVKFITPIYHPNIDDGGRICLSVLKLPPSGTWGPVMRVSTVLNSILILMSEPNPDDPLMVDINDVFLQDPQAFFEKALEHTQRYAVQQEGSIVQEPGDDEVFEPIVKKRKVEEVDESEESEIINDA